MTKEIRFTPTKPRSMNRVLSDVEYCIANDVDSEIIETDIEQLISQLKNLRTNLSDRKTSYKLINPTSNYYD